MPSTLLDNISNLKKNEIGTVTVYQSVFEYINSNMYVIKEGNEALVVDPHKSQKLIDALKFDDISKITILLTHEHPDHISGIYWYQEKFSSVLISTKACANHISLERNVRPILMNFYLEEQDRINGTNLLEKFRKDYVIHTYNPDITFEDNYKMTWCGHSLEFFKILGHSKGSCGIILDENIVFTGDSLMKDLPVITRFPGGNRKTYISETLPLLENKLKPDMWIMPGHGEPFQLKEIMKDGKINVEFR